MYVLQSRGLHGVLNSLRDAIENMEPTYDESTAKERMDELQLNYISKQIKLDKQDQIKDTQ